MSGSINFASTPIVGAATLTTGDTSRSAPATVSTLLTPASGGQIERISIIPLATTIASVVRIFRYDGAAYHLYTEIPVSAVTVTAGAAVQTTTLEAVSNPNLFPILLPAGWSLRATVNDTQTGIKIQAEGGGY